MRLNLRQRYLLAHVGTIAVAAVLVSVWQPESRYAVTTIAIVAVAAGWACSRIGASRLRRSASRLRQAADAVGSGDFSKRVAWHESDDLAKLAQAFNRMADRLQSMAEEEQQLRSQLARTERLAAIGELAATVAHEVNNPLDGIQNCTRIMRRDIDNTEQIARLLDLMDGGLYRIEMIVRRLLTYARDEAMNLVPTPIDAVFDDALMFVQPRLDKHGVRLVRPRLERPVFAMADRTQLAQALINLLLNAVDSAAPGGRIELGVREPADGGRMVQLIIEDDGEGIAPEHLPRIFEPFFSTKGPGGGTGLGLAVVKKIVSAHHGSIDVDSHVGEGTRFVVCLPAATAGPTADETAADSRAATLVHAR